VRVSRPYESNEEPAQAATGAVLESDEAMEERPQPRRVRAGFSTYEA